MHPIQQHRPQHPGIAQSIRAYASHRHNIASWHDETPTFVCGKHTDEKTMPPLQLPPSQPRWGADQKADAEKPAKAMS
jgi:hypothetical protein